MTSEPVMVLTGNLDCYLNLRKDIQIKSKKFGNEVSLSNYNFIIIFQIYC